MMYAESNLKLLKRTLNKQLQVLNEWFISNKLTLNLSKTHYMLIGNKNTITPTDRKKFKLSIGKYTLHEVEQFKYLGVILDQS